MNREEINIYDYNLIPIVREFYADHLTPVLVLERLLSLSNKVFLLESANNSGTKGRYSFLGFNPEEEIIIKKEEFSKRSQKGLEPKAILKDLLEKYRSPIINDLPPFTGGLIGYFSYDYFKYEEPTVIFKNEDPYGFADLHLFLVKSLIVFDHFKDKILIISNADTKNFEESKKEALKKIEEIKETISVPSSFENKVSITQEFSPEYSETEYADIVQKAREYIIEGDIFQVVPSNRIKGKVEGSFLNPYRVLRSDNPSPYMYFLKFDNFEIIGTSPETLVKLEDKVVSTFPIAGSRPRGLTEKEDKALEEGLLKDEKELAEHNMLVDLGRNDIGKISKIGSVKVEDYQAIQKYSKIMHITSKVTGEIRDDLTAIDALGSVLPAGTLSGAPKIRACQIIEELEKERRGPYGGAIGYLAFNGNMDMCIAIRSAYRNGCNAFVQSGGGIVYDSQPHPEYLETVNKAKAVIEAIKKGEHLKDDFNS